MVQKHYNVFVILAIVVIIFGVVMLFISKKASAGGGEGSGIISDVKNSAFQILNKTDFVMKAEPLGAEVIKISQTGVYSGGTMTAVYRVKNYSKTADYALVVRPEFPSSGMMRIKWLNPESFYTPGGLFVLGRSSERDLELSFTADKNFYGLIPIKISMYRVVKTGEANFYTHYFEVNVEPVEVRLVESTPSVVRPGQSITLSYSVKNHSALAWSVMANMKFESRMEIPAGIESRWAIDGGRYAPGNPFIVNPGQELSLRIVIFPPEGEEIPVEIEIYRATVPVPAGKG